MRKLMFAAIVWSILGNAYATSTLVEYPQGSILWNEFCNANAIEQDSADIPYPNYKNGEILKAVEKLNYIANAQEVDSDTFWLYSDIEKVYNLCTGTKKQNNTCPEINVNGLIVHQNTHNFLTILCGEFRDNVALLEAKLKWVQNINIVKNQKQTYDKNKGVWEQLTGSGYNNLVRQSGRLYNFRLNALGSNGSSNKTVDQHSVDAMTTCEYRYLLKQYISKEDKNVYYEEDFAKYEQGLQKFFNTSECSEDEKTHYNEFRGDGNFKPQSLESNAFIWNTRIFSQNCKTTKQANPGSILTNEQCENYFKHPFSSRYNLAMEGVYRLFFYPKELDRVMERSSVELVFMTEDLNKDGVADMIVLDVSEKPGEKIAQLRAQITALKKAGQHGIANVYTKVMHFALLKAGLSVAQIDPQYEKVLEQSLITAEKVIIELKAKWQEKVDKEGNDNFKKDIEVIDYFLNLENFDGVNFVTETENTLEKSLGLLDKGFFDVFPRKEDAWNRIATVLDRHTDWYKIDMLYLGYGFYQPTYSPWVASSYYINKSDVFTKPGYAMGLAGDGHKHWMFVQKVKMHKWYRAYDMNGSWNKNAFDLLNTWFDETTFSRTGLGAQEQGWDRFGSVTNDELDANLWLYEINPE